MLNGEASGLQLNGNDFINGIDPKSENSNIDHRILKVIFENVDRNPALRNVNKMRFDLFCIISFFTNLTSCFAC